MKRARRLEKGSNIGWKITVQPNTNGDIAVSLPVRACDATGAICTADDRTLSEAVSAMVPGPASQTREVSMRSVTPDNEVDESAS